jgi:hypothetical protein
MAENTEVIIIQLSNPGESFPEDLNNIVMSSADGATSAISEGTSSQIAIPIGTVDDFAMGNTTEEIAMPVDTKDQMTMENSSEEIATPVPGNGQEPEIQTMSETYFCDTNVPIPGEKQEEPPANEESTAESSQEGATVTAEEDATNVIGITHADGVLSVDIPLADVMADPSITPTTSAVVNSEATIPTYTDTNEMSIASTALTDTQASLSKPQPRIILKTNTQVSPSPSPSTSPAKKVVIPAGICVKSYLDDQVAYKITTSDVTEAISAVRTTSSQINTTKLAPKSTMAKSKQTHQLVVTSMGLVRKALIPEPPLTEPTASVEKLSSPVQVTTKIQPRPTITDSTPQTFTLTDIESATAPLLPENEMIQSSHVEHLQGESLSGISMSESSKQKINSSSENMEVGSYLTIDALRKIKEESRDEDDWGLPVRKSYRAPKRKAVQDYDEIGVTVTPEDESAPTKKRAKTVTVTSPRKPVKAGKKPGPKSKNKLTVEEVYRSEEEGEGEDVNNDFLKVCMIKCDKCDKHFLDKKKLSHHKSQVHKTKRAPRTSGKEHICDVCGYVFKRREHWRRHKEVHQKSRPYNCEVCNKTFKRAEHVKRHQSVHFTDKPFPCLECSSAFTRHDHLAKHMLLHNDPEGYRQRRLAKKKKGNAGRGRPKGKGSKMIKTMPRGRGKVTVELREKVKAKREEADFEYGDIPEEYEDLETDEGDLLSTDEEERGGYDGPRPTSLQKVY